MKTIILPGLSKTNREWAIEVVNKFENNSEIELIEWETWIHSGKINIKEEGEKVLKGIGDNKVNIIAKSIGTYVFMNIFDKIQNQINKVVLCGIPIDPVKYLQGIRNLGDKLLVIQNSHDPYMPFYPVKLFVQLINKKATLIEKESSTHDYPYYNEFKNWIGS